MDEEIQKAETGARKAWPLVMSWVGGITALIGFFGSIGGGITWYANHQRQKTELRSKMALAQGQSKQGEYQVSIQSYGVILKDDPLYRPALDQQLDTAMLWIEEFHVSARPGQNSADAAAAALDQVMPIIDAGLARSKGSKAADVQAHIGWAHWLNNRIANREFGDMDEQSLRAALKSDPSNVYANAMLGAWMLQTGGSFTEAIQHLNSAVATGKALPFVRKLQFGSLDYLDKKGAKAELVRAANSMRKSGEFLDEEHKPRVLGFCFNPLLTAHGELAESLSAVPPDEAWATYLWLDDRPENAKAHGLDHDFVKANLLELSGKRQEALTQYRLVQQELKDESFTMKNSVNAAIARLSHS